MKSTTKRKILSKGLKGTSAVLAGGVPIWLIAQKFPLWAVEQEPKVALTGGGLAVVIVAVLAFRKRISNAVKPIREKMKASGGVVLGTVILSAVILGICTLVRRLYPILPDLETICMGGVVSGLGGVALDSAAMAVAPKKDDEKKSNTADDPSSADSEKKEEKEI
jgi:hypothetical protein